MTGQQYDETSLAATLPLPKGRGQGENFNLSTMLPPGAAKSCGESGIHIDRDGTWFYHGSPIGRKSLVRLFAKILTRQADGSFALVTPVEHCPVTVADAPFLSVDFSVREAEAGPTIWFVTNIDEEIPLIRPDSMRIVSLPLTDEPRPYIMVRPGLEARLTRAVFYDLVDRAVRRRHQGREWYGVLSAGSFFPLGLA